METLSDIILHALPTDGQWVTRREIAKRIGRTRGLLPYDVQVLNELVDSGQVESRNNTRGIVGARFEYRVKAVQSV